LNANDKLLLWLSLFKAETEEELEKIKALEVPVMEQAINGIQKGVIGVARNALQMNVPIADIAKMTGLTIEKVEQLRK